MSASKDEQRGVELARVDHDRSATARGHVLRWELGENANRRGHAYFWLGTCKECGATVTVGASWSSSQGPTDARKGRCRMAHPPERATSRRQTATPGLVVEKVRGAFRLVHAASGEHLHPVGMRSQGDVLAAAVSLGQLAVDWTLGKADMIAAANAHVQGGMAAVLQYLVGVQTKSWAPPPNPARQSAGGITVEIAGGRR